MMQKQWPIAAVTEYRGWRIVFDGTFAVINEAGRVVALGLWRLDGAKHLVDSVLCAREFD
ncbi:hypothetical protein [Paraburkholderia sediminicola]|uniref:hypothetical protein n=1 Tax=Paraburkholderia sediminicola TaxID=458836 RepID=UPI0038B742DE